MRKDPARVEPMTIDVDRAKWAAPRNRLPPRRHSEEKQRAIRSQVDALLRLGVIVTRFFSKALTGAQLNWHTRGKDCYGIFFGVKLFEAELDGRYFILRTDHKKLTYINATFVGKILR